MKYTVRQYIENILITAVLFGFSWAVAYVINNTKFEVLAAEHTGGFELQTTVKKPESTTFPKPDPVKKIPTYPTDPNARLEFLLKKLSEKGYNASELKAWRRILSKETSSRALDQRGGTVVKHCMRRDGSWYAVEVYNGRQANCRGGDTEGMNERSIGPFQILEKSNWKRLGCGDKKSYQAHVNCAVKIQRLSGFTQWSTY